MVHKKFVNQLKNNGWRVRESFRNVLNWRRQRSFNYKHLRDELSPIFVIGANRSGTSVITSILAQHPDLEGIFNGAERSRYDDIGHSIGFCESMHVWYYMMPDPELRRPQGHLPFWGLPIYIGKAYHDRASGDKERRRLAWDLNKHRRTDKIPLLKDQFNTLRIGLIADVFPKARFVLCCRSWEDFSSRSIHKWCNDGSGTAMDRPLAGLHWNMVNMVARYDLEIYSPNQYTIVWLDTLHSGPEKAIEAFAGIVSGLSLKPFEFDFSMLSHNWKRPSSDSFSRSVGFTDVPSIVKSERQILTVINKNIAIK